MLKLSAGLNNVTVVSVAYPSTTYFESDPVDMQDTTPSLSPSYIILNPATLPRNSKTFFDNWPHAKPLPTPAQIRSSTFDSTFRILHHREHGPYAQRVLHIPDLGLVIKHGPRTTIAEGQTLWAVGKYCPQVRVPTVYGWFQDGDFRRLHRLHSHLRLLGAHVSRFTTKEEMDVVEPPNLTISDNNNNSEQQQQQPQEQDMARGLPFPHTEDSNGQHTIRYITMYIFFYFLPPLSPNQPLQTAEH